MVPSGPDPGDEQPATGRRRRGLSSVPRQGEDRPDAAPATMLPVPRWVAPVFLGLAVLTVPWIVYLGLTLPSRSLARHYDLAWVGFDVALVVALLRTGWLAARGRDHIELPAVAAATLLCVDAWFDVVTAPSASRMAVAMASAVFVELPLALLCAWIVRHAESVRRDRLRFFRRRARAVGVVDAPRVPD